MVYVGLPVDAESLLTHQTRRSAARLCCARSWTWSHRIDRSRGEFGARPAAQTISTGRASQPHRPPGSMQCESLLATTHRPLLSQPLVNPHRWPDGHCESIVQLTVVCEVRLFGPFAFVVWHPASRKAAKSQTTRVRRCANADKGLLITVERGACGFLRSKSIFQLLRDSNY